MDLNNIGLTPTPSGSTTLPAAGSSQATAPTGGAPSALNSTTTVGLNSIPTPSSDITISKHFMSNNSWPADLHLDLAKSNWEEWSFQLNCQTDRLGFMRWLKGTLPHLDAILHPKAHDIWETNNCSLRGFIYTCISKLDYTAISHLSTSHLIYVELQQCHEKLGLQAQLILLKKALDFHYNPDGPYCDGAEEILAMHSRIANMGPVDLDQIKVILLLNAFRNNSEHLQSSLYSIMDSPSFGANTILCHLQQEDTIIHAHADQSGNAATTLTAICRDKPPYVCSNCKKEGHLASYCIQTGEGMVGKTLDE